METSTNLALILIFFIFGLFVALVFCQFMAAIFRMGKTLIANPSSRLKFTGTLVLLLGLQYGLYMIWSHIYVSNQTFIENWLVQHGCTGPMDEDILDFTILIPLVVNFIFLFAVIKKLTKNFKAYLIDNDLESKNNFYAWKSFVEIFSVLSVILLFLTQTSPLFDSKFQAFDYAACHLFSIYFLSLTFLLTSTVFNKFAVQSNKENLGMWILGMYLGIWFAPDIFPSFLDWFGLLALLFLWICFFIISFKEISFSLKELLSFPE